MKDSLVYQIRSLFTLDGHDHDIVVKSSNDQLSIENDFHKLKKTYPTERYQLVEIHTVVLIDR